ncbi:MAG: hypothetical protein OSJ73_11120 [Lachnospiraceae bacterium]|nr:hypothetical protein [Lachnospiraceae bacterium]
MDFLDDHSVRVSEGGSSHGYDYTIDSMGNIVIDPENEALEGTYNSAIDELSFYGKNTKNKKLDRVHGKKSL